MNEIAEAGGSSASCFPLLVVTFGVEYFPPPPTKMIGSGLRSGEHFVHPGGGDPQAWGPPIFTPHTEPWRVREQTSSSEVRRNKQPCPPPCDGWRWPQTSCVSWPQWVLLRLSILGILESSRWLHTDLSSKDGGQLDELESQALGELWNPCEYPDLTEAGGRGNARGLWSQEVWMGLPPATPQLCVILRARLLILETEVIVFPLGVARRLR